MQGERKVRIIAEAGVNHNGDIELAKQLIDLRQMLELIWLSSDF